MENQEQQEKKGPLALNDGNKTTFMAILSYLGPFVIIPLAMGMDDSFVKFHTKQGLVLAIIWVLERVILMFIASKSLLLVFGIINVALVILAIIGIINVIQGKEKELPIIGGLAKKFTF